MTGWTRAGSMKQAAFLACAALLCATAPSLARTEPVRYELDPEHLTVAFLVEHIGYANTLGFFRKASGSYAYDEATGEVSDVRVVVDTSSVYTAHEKRDEHLRGDDFLDVGRHPQMVFTAQRAQPAEGNRYRIEGELELLGRTAPVVLEATLNKAAEYPIGGGLLRGKPFVQGVSARGSFERSAFGMEYAIANGLVADEIDLIIEFEAKRQD
jgi:polyisoprenoid-binding protein YceI